jgi:hypothetical protein
MVIALVSDLLNRSALSSLLTSVSGLAIGSRSVPNSLNGL